MDGRRKEMAEISIKDAALLFAHQADQVFGKSDPRQPFVALMTAAAVAGHIIERTPEEMHEVLDKVIDLAQAAMLEATQTKQ